jgi:hypothetical protein
MAVTLIGLISPVLVVVFATMSMVASYLLGMLTVSQTGIFSLAIVMGVILYLMRRDS